MHNVQERTHKQPILWLGRIKMTDLTLTKQWISGAGYKLQDLTMTDLHTERSRMRKAGKVISQYLTNASASVVCIMW